MRFAPGLLALGSLAVGLAALGLLCLAPSSATAQSFHVAPYVQDVTPESAWILWETSEGDESTVEWGTSASLGSTAAGTFLASVGTHRVHEVRLTGLSPATRYHYRVRTGSAVSEVFHFTTAPRREDEVTFRLIAMSDMQIDRANPDVYRSVIHDGVLDWLASEGGDAGAVAFVLVPGDLVDDGREYESWAAELFAPAADLMRHVAFYPVLGNHEQNSVNYYRYFHLPENGSFGDRDRWWAMSWSNVRVIGLDSNLLLLLGDQERFLERELEEACGDPSVDFVFVQMHHAHRSELWRPGESAIGTQVVDRMNRFSEECGKPSLHLHGHTHAYARGASRDHSHVWINVASAGGNIDYWGEYDDERDVDELEVSQDEWGFVVIDVTAGDAPSFRVRRISRGNEALARDNELRAELTVRRYTARPRAPIGAAPRGAVRTECASLEAGAFEDPDGDAHAATHWQVGASCDDFARPVLERYRTRVNWFREVDRQAGDDLTDEPAAGLEPGNYYCWRVRYRDSGLVWSEWSSPIAFRLDDGGAGIAQGCADARPIEPPDAGVDAGPDAGQDAGPGGADAGTVAQSSGCGCHAAGPAPVAPSILLFALVLVCRRRDRVTQA